MTAVELLRKAKARARSEDDLVLNWVNTAEDAGRCPVNPGDATACHFCAIGFLVREAGEQALDPVYDEVEDIVFTAARKIDFETTDPHTLAEVHILFDLAIDLATERALAAQRTKEL